MSAASRSPESEPESEPESAGARPEARAAAPSAARRWGRRALRLGLCGLCLLLVLVALAPMVVSSDVGTRWATALVNGAIPGTVALRDLEVGWVGGTRVSELELRDPGGEVVAPVPRTELTGRTLLAAALGSRDLGTMTLRQPRLHLRRYPDGTSNLSRALASRASDGNGATTEPRNDGGAPDALRYARDLQLVAS